MGPELQRLLDDFDAIDKDALALVTGISEAQGTWRPAPGSWSIAECLDHLAVTNAVYLRSMQKAARVAKQQMKLRRGPAIPGVIGRWFARSLEPPVKGAFKTKARKFVQPGPSISVAEAYAKFKASQQPIRDFIAEYAEIDLVSVRFANPFLPGARFSLATGLHVLAAHERRHLWQAWRVRQAI
jgi:hypothetical protein